MAKSEGDKLRHLVRSPATFMLFLAAGAAFAQTPKERGDWEFYNDNGWCVLQYEWNHGANPRRLEFLGFEANSRDEMGKPKVTLVRWAQGDLSDFREGWSIEKEQWVRTAGGLTGKTLELVASFYRFDTDSQGGAGYVYMFGNYEPVDPDRSSHRGLEHGWMVFRRHLNGVIHDPAMELPTTWEEWSMRLAHPGTVSIFGFYKDISYSTSNQYYAETGQAITAKLAAFETCLNSL